MSAAGEKHVTGTLEQWATRVINFSTQYDSCGWAASCVLGKPKVFPQYGDNSGAWAQGNCDGNEFIELAYEHPVYVSAIHIYETWNCGGVRRVLVQTPKGGWDSVWETDDIQHIHCSRIFSPDIKCPGYRTKGVRLDVDCSVSGSWVEIDAVQLVGRKLKIDPPPSASDVLADLVKLVNDQESSDLVVHVEDKVVYAHRAILAVRSDTLKQLIADHNQGSITIRDIGYQAFLGVLGYIYGGTVPSHCSPVDLVDVWRAASRLSLPGLCAHCVVAVDEKLDVDNVIDVFLHASVDDPVSRDIREVCLEFLAPRLASVSRTPQFNQLSQTQMLEIVQESTSKLSLV